MKCLENNFLCIRVRAACGTAWMRGEQRSYLDLWWRLRWHLRQTNVFSWILIDTNYDVGTCEVVILMTFIGQLHGPTFEAGSLPRQRLGVTYVYGGGIYGRTTLSRRYSEILSLPPSAVELQTKVHEDWPLWPLCLCPNFKSTYSGLTFSIVS